MFQQACQLGCEGIVSKRLGSRYRSGRSPDWLKFRISAAPAVKREAERRLGSGDDSLEAGPQGRVTQTLGCRARRLPLAR